MLFSVLSNIEEEIATTVQTNVSGTVGVAAKI